MGVSNRHILEQGATFGALSRVAWSALEQQVSKRARPRQAAVPVAPGPFLEETYAPRSPELIQEYLRHVGGDPAAYRGAVPAHLFPQWGFGLASRAISDLPYPLARVLNGGCNMEINGPLPADEPLNVVARLESIDDDGRRAVPEQRIVTSTTSSKRALVASMFAIVPLGAAGKTPGGKKEAPRVPDDARELAYFNLSSRAGLDFAKLTGDFNPVHWIPAYARASGFPNVILHGFATMARAIEGVHRGIFAGDVTRIKKWSCRFTKPLVLPAQTGLYVRQNDVYVGIAPGGPAYLVGRFEA